MTAAQYHLYAPGDICQSTLFEAVSQEVEIMGISVLIEPNVCPSQYFRSTRFLMEHLTSFVKGKSMCDMGCGCGVVGLHALKNGAKRVVQVDINRSAVQNARDNRRLHKYSSKRLAVYNSDCFDDVPKQKFDVIAFNIPFHSDPIEIRNELELAFFDPDFRSTRKCLQQAQDFIKADSIIIIAFSDKGDVTALERLLNDTGFAWHLWQRGNTMNRYDSRLYFLTSPSGRNLYFPLSQGFGC